jgi:hypothetical protein
MFGRQYKSYDYFIVKHAVAVNDPRGDQVDGSTAQQQGMHWSSSSSSSEGCNCGATASTAAAAHASRTMAVLVDLTKRLLPAVNAALMMASDTV